MHTASKALLAAAALTGTGMLATPASARTYVSVGIGAPLYPRYYAPRPVYYPGYYPGYYAPPVVYRGYYGPRPYYYGHPWRGYYHRGYYGRPWR